MINRRAVSAEPSPPAEGALDCIELLLRTAELVASRRLGTACPAERFALVRRLAMARRAVADLKPPATPSGERLVPGYAAVAAVGESDGVLVDPRAGHSFSLPRPSGPPGFDRP